MAKKNTNIASLINGIVNDTPQENTHRDIAPSTVEALDISPELLERLNAVRKAKSGRPVGSHSVKPREHRATFIVSEEIVQKLKYISLMDCRLLKDVVTEALTEAIAKWEEENGTIVVKTKKA